MNLQELQVHDIYIIRRLLSRIFLFIKIMILLSQKILTLSIVVSQNLPKPHCQCFQL